LRDDQGGDTRERTLPPIDIATLPDHPRRPFEGILLYADLQRASA
jgi:hypothetical protein